jgi:hypothetical protein
MEYAITELEIALNTAENNAPIYEREGNHEQAEACRRHAESYRAAIVKLKQ